MLPSKLDDELAIRLGEGVEGDDEPIGTLLDRSRERGPQISSLPNVEELGFDAQGSRRALNLFPRRRHGRATHVAQGRDPNGFRNQRAEKLNTFRIQLCDHRVQPCDVPAGRARLATMPCATGSPAPVMTMGIVFVAFWVARIACVPRITIMSTWPEPGQPPAPETARPVRRRIGTL